MENQSFHFQWGDVATCDSLLDAIFLLSLPLYNFFLDLFVVRVSVPLVTRSSTLEVVIPEQAVPKLIANSNSKLAQISEVCMVVSFSPLLSICELASATTGILSMHLVLKCHAYLSSSYNRNF